MVFFGDVEISLESGYVFSEDAGEGCGVAQVNGCEEHDHNRGSSVDEPVGCGPGDLGAVGLDFVGFLVSAVVDGFAGEDDYEDRSVADEVVEAGEGDFLFAANLLLSLRVTDNKVFNALAETCAGGMLGEFNEFVGHFVGDKVSLEVSYCAPLEDC